jgi:transposase-like protein
MGVLPDSLSSSLAAAVSPSPFLAAGNKVMLEADVIQLGSVQHLIQCPHCEKQAVQKWFGTMILYTAAKCKNCGREFVIALNETRP